MGSFKAQSTLNLQHRRGDSDRKRRQLHNDSAACSRERLNKTLEKLWKMIPEDEYVTTNEGLSSGESGRRNYVY